jgi:hypothetical protein
MMASAAKDLEVIMIMLLTAGLTFGMFIIGLMVGENRTISKIGSGEWHIVTTTNSPTITYTYKKR